MKSDEEGGELVKRNVPQRDEDAFLMIEVEARELSEMVEGGKHAGELLAQV